MVDNGHLELPLKVRHGAQALDNDPGVSLPGIVRQQCVGGIHLHVIHVLGDPANHLHPLFQCKHGMLVSVDHDADDELVEALGRPGNDIEMAVVMGSKLPG